jgi:3-isopropylmalate/(R)-2-methylmalate dehydratase small subunit
MITGKAIKFGDNIDTDQIIGAEHLTLPTIEDMVKFTFKNHKNFADNYQQGDVIIGGHNFGCGSSREQAPAVLKEAGVGAIIAKSFARIFFRNAINLGLMVLECKDTDKISNLDQLQIDPVTGKIQNLTKKQSYQTTALPPYIKAVLDVGGIVNYMRAKASEQ